MVSSALSISDDAIMDLFQTILNTTDIIVPNVTLT